MNDEERRSLRYALQTLVDRQDRLEDIAEGAQHGHPYAQGRADGFGSAAGIVAGAMGVSVPRPNPQPYSGPPDALIGDVIDEHLAWLDRAGSE